MRRVLRLVAVIGIFALGVLAGRISVLVEPPDQGGLFADPTLARALLHASTMELAQSDCTLSIQSGESPTVADFVLSYISAASLPPGKASVHAECGGRGEDKCSTSYSVLLEEHADTNILLFSRDADGKLVTGEVTCLAQ